MLNCFVVFEDDGRRSVQKAMTSNPFFGSSKKQCDTVLVSGGEGKGENVSTNKLEEFLVWPAKALAFEQIDSEMLENDLRNSHRKNFV